MKSLILSLTLLLFCMNVFSQDTLYKRDGKTIIAKVIEISPDYVKYISPGNDSPVIAIDKDDLIKIVFANGVIQWIVPEMINPEHYADQKKNDIKVDFMAPMYYHTTIIYEHSIKPGMSWESGATIVGLGYNSKDSEIKSAGGIIWNAGIKFIRSPDFYLRGMRYAHILKGGYIRPQFWLGYFEETTVHGVYNPNTLQYILEDFKNNYTITGFHLQIGKQWVMGDNFLVDIFGGLGYAFVSKKYDESSNQYDFYYSRSYYYTFSKAGESSPFSVSGGLRIGILF